MKLRLGMGSKVTEKHWKWLVFGVLALATIPFVVLAIGFILMWRAYGL